MYIYSKCQGKGEDHWAARQVVPAQVLEACLCSWCFLHHPKESKEICLFVQKGEHALPQHSHKY